MHRHGGSTRPRIRLALTLAMASVFFATRARAQEPTFGIGEDASVAAPGTLRVGVRSDFLYADALRRGSERTPLASRLGFAASDSVFVTAAVSITRLPFTIEYGVFPHFSLGVTVPVVRRRVEIAADTGLNPDSTLTKRTTRLKDIGALSSVTHTNVGDIEFAARFGVLDDFASRHPLRARLAVEGVFRLAAGPSRTANVFVDPGAGDGQNDLEARVLADVGLGPRFTVAARGARTWQRPDRQSVVYADSVFPSGRTATGVARDLGDITAIDVTPKFRFTHFLSLAATVSHRAKTADRWSGEAPAAAWGLVADPVGSYTVTRAGVGIVFSTASSSGGAIGPWPLELAFQHAVTLASSGAAVPDYRFDQLAGRLYIKLF